MPSLSVSLLICLLGVTGVVPWTFLGTEPTNPTPGTTATAFFHLDRPKEFNLEHVTGNMRFFYQQHIFASNYTILQEDQKQYWSCNDQNCSSTDPNGVCYQPGGAGSLYECRTPRFSVDLAIPPDAILHTYNHAGLWIQMSTHWEYELEDRRHTAPAVFTTGEAVVSLNSSVQFQPSSFVPGQTSDMLEVLLSNSGPSAARNSTCDVVLSHGVALVGTPSCQPTQNSNRWQCTRTGDIFPLAQASISQFGLLPSPDFRGPVTIEVTDCAAFGNVNSMVPSFLSIPTAPVWRVSQSYDDQTESSLQTNSAARISFLVHNDGPSSSLDSLCSWNFSVAALSLERAEASQVTDCEARYEPNLVVSCKVDAAPGDTTAAVSVSPLPALAGTPSFDVSFSCVDEAGDPVAGGEPKFSVMFIEELEDVDVSVRLVNWQVDEDEEPSESWSYEESEEGSDEEVPLPSKRELDDLGTTTSGAIIFDEAIALLLEANIQGALYSRNVSCHMKLAGGDMPLVHSQGIHSNSCIDHGLQYVANVPSFWLVECGFEELVAEEASKGLIVFGVDPRVRSLNISVECDSTFPNTIDNPVFHQSFQFIHVDAVPDDGNESSDGNETDGESESDNKNESGEDESFMDKWLWIVVGGGGGLLLLLVIVPTLICLVHRKRRASLQRKRNNLMDLEAGDEMEVYATPKTFSHSKASNQESLDIGGIQWEIPFEELEFEEEIGKGGFGVVWRGKWRETPVAIKMFNSIMDSLALKENFQAEMNIMKNLRPHTNVVQLFGVCMEDDHPWCLVTEYLAQGDLKHYLRNNHLQEDYDAIIGMAIQVARGMHHLHSEGLIHRDLAARNILLTSERSIKVGDFGLSRMLDGYVSEAKVPVRWTAPEALDGKGEPTEKSDVWSYGVLIWEMVNSGETPYAGKTNVQVVMSVLNGEVLSLPSSAPQILHSILRQCFQLNPKKRPSFRDIIKSLQKYKEG
ncbi:Mast/stem cell growth factor receptor [Balamuthia mandrillaris]